MTAPSELFCDETVRDEAKALFDDKIPESYDYIEIPDEWKDLWNVTEFPPGGLIIYRDENKKEVAKVHFDIKLEIVKGNHYGADVDAYPTRLVLELPDGTKIIDKSWLIADINEMISKVRNLRDEQQVIPCIEGEKYDICGFFDAIVDDCNHLIKEIEERD